jgi:hypothetical protein
VPVGIRGLDRPFRIDPIGKCLTLKDLKDLICAARALAAIGSVVVAVAEAEFDDLGPMAVRGRVIPGDQRTFRSDFGALADPKIGALQHDLAYGEIADRSDRCTAMAVVEVLEQARKQLAQVVQPVQVLLLPIPCVVEWL